MRGEGQLPVALWELRSPRWPVMDPADCADENGLAVLADREEAKLRAIADPAPFGTIAWTMTRKGVGMRRSCAQ